MKFMILVIFTVICTIGFSNAFLAASKKRLLVKPLQENFFLDIAEDPAKNTPRQIFGEVAYKNFVGEYKPDALLLDSKYDIISRLRETKLLTLTAESGLLEALESKGLTLSQVEKLLPVIDSLGILPLALKYKDVLLSFAPLLIEPAPLIIPSVVSVLKTPPSTFIAPGVGLIGFGLYESLDNSILGLLSLMVGFPFVVVGSLLSGTISLPTPSSPSITQEPATVVSAPRPVVAAKKAAPSTVAVEKSVPTVSTPKVTVSSVAKSSNINGKRKTIRIK